MTRYGTLIGQYRPEVIPHVKATIHKSEVYFSLMFNKKRIELLKFKMLHLKFDFMVLATNNKRQINIFFIFLSHIIIFF